MRIKLSALKLPKKKKKNYGSEQLDSRVDDLKISVDKCQVTHTGKIALMHAQ